MPINHDQLFKTTQIFIEAEDKRQHAIKLERAENEAHEVNRWAKWLAALGIEAEEYGTDIDDRPLIIAEGYSFALFTSRDDQSIKIMNLKTHQLALPYPKVAFGANPSEWDQGWVEKQQFWIWQGLEYLKAKSTAPDPADERPDLLPSGDKLLSEVTNAYAALTSVQYLVYEALDIGDLDNPEFCKRILRTVADTADAILGAPKEYAPIKADDGNGLDPSLHYGTDEDGSEDPFRCPNCGQMGHSFFLNEPESTEDDDFYICSNCSKSYPEWQFKCGEDFVDDEPENESLITFAGDDEPDANKLNTTAKITEVRHIITRDNEMMSLAVDQLGREFIFFPRTLKKYGELLVAGANLVIDATIHLDRGKPEFVVNSVALDDDEIKDDVG